MFFEGFLRSLQQDVLLMGILLAVIAVSYVVALVMPTPSEVKKTAWKLAWIGSAAVIAIFAVTAVVRGATNRAPRSDVDPSGVYHQMGSH